MADVSEVQIEGNATKLYQNLVYAGIEFTSNLINASGMTHFHMNIWTPDATALPAVFKIKLVDFGADGAYAGGDDTEQELIFDANTNPPLVTEGWITFDIPLTDFTSMTSTSHIAQLIISGDPNTVYVDNVLFRNHTTAVDDPAASSVPARLGNSYPNPFSSSSSIRYKTPGNQPFSIEIFNLRGQKVRTLVKGFSPTGTQILSWDGKDDSGGRLSSGTYICMLSRGSQRLTRKLVLLAD